MLKFTRSLYVIDEGLEVVFQLFWIRSYVKLFSAMTLGNLDGCKNACTRAVCYPLGGAKTSQCYQVDNNEYCGIDGGNTCKYMLLDYTQSFTT